MKFSRIPSVSVVFRQALPYPVRFSHIPSSSTVSCQLLPYPVKFSRIQSVSPVFCQCHLFPRQFLLYPVNFSRIPSMSPVSPSISPVSCFRCGQQDSCSWLNKICSGWLIISLSMIAIELILYYSLFGLARIIKFF